MHTTVVQTQVNIAYDLTSLDLDLLKKFKLREFNVEKKHGLQSSCESEVNA